MMTSSIFQELGRLTPAPVIPTCDGYHVIAGESMAPVLKGGDIVLYRVLNDPNNIVWGEMYLVHIHHNGEDYHFSKYVRKSERPGYVVIAGTNPETAPVEFPQTSIVRIARINTTIRVEMAA